MIEMESHLLNQGESPRNTASKELRKACDTTRDQSNYLQKSANKKWHYKHEHVKSKLFMHELVCNDHAKSCISLPTCSNLILMSEGHRLLRTVIVKSVGIPTICSISQLNSKQIAANAAKREHPDESLTTEVLPEKPALRTNDHKQLLHVNTKSKHTSV